ncbi:MAG: PTS fructose transporter subunit IIA, partial [Longicatena sp.]
MIGIIVSGHGNFATGMNSAMKLLNGDCKELRCIDFLEGTSFEDLCDTLNQMIEDMNMDHI